MGLICFITAPLIYAALFNIPFLLSLCSSGRERKAAATSSFSLRNAEQYHSQGQNAFKRTAMLCVLVHQYPNY